MTSRRLPWLALAALALLLPAARRAGAEPKPRVLIIPIGGTLEGPMAGAPKRFDKVIAEVAGEVGTEPLTARVGKAEVTAIIGCADDESTECFEESASMLGVERIVFGQVEATPDGTQVTLTYFRSGEPVRRKQWVLGSAEVQPASEEVRAVARELFAPAPAEPAQPPPVVEPPPPQPLQPQPGPQFSFGRVKPWTWGVVGGGAALLGLSALFFALAADKQDQVDAAPTDSLDDLHRLEDLESSGRRLTLLGNLSLAAGAVAVTAGAVLIWRQGRAPDEAPAVALVPLAGGAGLVWSGAF